MTTTIDRPAAPLDRDGVDAVLAAVDVRIRRQQRVSLAAGGVLPLGTDGLSVVFVLSGALHADPIEKARRVRTAHASRGTHASVVCDGGAALWVPQLASGDIALSLGRRPLVMNAETDAELLVSSIEFPTGAEHIADLLPDVAAVQRFEQLEPAAAAIARTIEPDGPFAREGDQVICRLLMRTLLASIIRAWAGHGCAPEGWPSLSNDPFLDRVVAAVEADPGHDWTVEGLASVGAMSRSVFAERFRSAYGRSPGSYVAEVRMRAAQELLERGLGVSAVSRELGYGSDEGFSRAFRRHTGLTPSAWRTSRTAFLATA
ncbi:hypothetical protein GCM10025768_03520 [Microbacterium pseudoresistens]|uniref:AraC-like DNA-binding protein n=1 Tax=Microbacterium pseudoresistens TaxID=640634 RepID=A0A7Y9JN42_9MICO|nr:AraC family transcriptional regulator [Microbacterium pseudoresistens]NYD54188.1 AraC-like DNA-binding protein [Microbacterium pseudoresistens]